MIANDTDRADANTLVAPPGDVEVDPCPPSDYSVDPQTIADLEPQLVVKSAKGTYRYTPTLMALKVHNSLRRYLAMLGSRGSSKSTSLRNDVHLKALKFSGYKALIVRNTFPALQKSHLQPVEREMFLMGGSYHRNNKIATYPNGSQLFFGSCDDQKTIDSYLSADFHYLGLDELVTIPLETFLSLDACVRVPTGFPLPPITRACSNKIGPQSRWVKRWFTDKTVSSDESESYDPNDFEVIESTLADNPFIDAKSYLKSLGNQPAHVRKAWIDNEWVLDGSYFNDFSPTKDGEPWHVVNSLPTVRGGQPLLEQPWLNVYRVMDFGWSPSPTVCLWIAVLPNGRGIVFKEMTWTETTAAEVSKDIKRASKGMRILDTFVDPSACIDGKGTGMTLVDTYEMCGIPMTPSINDRAASGMAIHEHLNTILDDGLPKLQILGSACPNLVKTFPELEINKNDPARIAKSKHDHWVIALGYYAQSYISPSRERQKSDEEAWYRPVRARTPISKENVRRHAA